MEEGAGREKAIMKELVLLILACWQATRFLRAPACRFYPSCSCFMASAIERHGLLKGLLLGLSRLARCHPLDPGGIDEVPEHVCVGKALAGLPLQATRGR